MGRWSIYILCDPREADPVRRVRYVGKTERAPRRRLMDHCRPYELRKDTHKVRWIKLLLAAGLRPVLEVVEEGDGPWEEAERRWMAHYEALGASLTNSKEGGISGPLLSAEAKEKIAASRRGKPLSAEQRRRISEANTGLARPKSEQWRRRHSALLTGRHLSEEHKRRLSEAGRGKPKPPGFGQKIAAANKGRVPSEEARRRSSETKKGKPLSLETRRKMAESQRRHAEAAALDWGLIKPLVLAELAAGRSPRELAGRWRIAEGTIAKWKAKMRRPST